MRKLDYKEFGTGKEQSGLYIRLTATAREGKCRGRSLSLSLASLPTRQARCYGKRDMIVGGVVLQVFRYGNCELPQLNSVSDIRQARNDSGSSGAAGVPLRKL
ncbi:hypothetical protein J6590_055469 [Homalodisca vitripennis]|nr:hypothetical protein J6590_055469 [Homalodisca vitripennis]